MGQVLSNVIRCLCICGEAEDESDQNPIEISSSNPLLIISPPLIPPSKTITNPKDEILQTHPSEYYYSCIDSSITTPPVSDPSSSPDLSNLIGLGDSTFNTTTIASGLNQNLLFTPRSVLDYYSPTVVDTLFSSSSTSEEKITFSDGDYKSLEEEPRGGKEEEEKVIIKAVVPVAIEEIRWIKQYSSFQKILLVGEGDFSFSASLAMAFGTARNIIATSLNSTGNLTN